MKYIRIEFFPGHLINFVNVFQFAELRFCFRWPKWARRRHFPWRGLFTKVCQGSILTSFKRSFVLNQFYEALTLFIKVYALSGFAENGFKEMGTRLSPAFYPWSVCILPPFYSLLPAVCVLHWLAHHEAKPIVSCFVFVKQLSSYAGVIFPSQSVSSSGTTQETCGKRRWSLFSELHQLTTTHIVINLVSLKLINYLLVRCSHWKKPFRACAVIFIQCRFVYHGCSSVDCNFTCLLPGSCWQSVYTMKL